MNIDIDKLIKQYKSKTKAEILDAEEMKVIIPVLLREIVSLKKQLQTACKYITVLESKKPSLERKGKSGKAEWEVKYQEKENRLFIRLSGIFNASSAKNASNAIINLLPHTQKNFDIITDVYELEAISDLKVLFHLKKVSFSFQQFNARRLVRIADKKNKTILKLFEKGFTDFSGSVAGAASVEDAVSYLDNDGTFLKQ